MYERTSFPATPKWARHLLRLANASKTPIDASLRDLARQLSYDVSVLPKHLRLSRKEHDAIQYMLDWNGRAVLLDMAGISFARHIMTLTAQLLDSKSIWILCHTPTDVLEWRQVLLDLFPDDAIYADVDKRIKNTTGNTDDTERRWLITTHHYVNDLDMVGNFKIDHVVFEKTLKDISYDSNDAILGLFQEMRKVSVLLQATDFWTDLSHYRSIQTTTILGSLISNYLRTNRHMAQVPSHFSTSQDVALYFRTRGRKYSPVSLFEASGACFDLILDKESTNFKNIFSSSMLVSAGAHSNRRSEVIRKYADEEAKLIERTGRTISETVDEALRGNKVAQVDLDGLKSPDWGKLKANAFYNLINAANSVEEKTIVVASHGMIRRYMSTTLNAVSLDDNLSPEVMNRKCANFVYPNPQYETFDGIPAYYECRIQNTVMTDNLVSLDPRVIEAADTVVVTEFQYDPIWIEELIELSRAFGFKLVFGTMRGTFEEILSERLLAQHY